MKVKDIVRAAGGTTTDMPQVPIALLAPNPDNMRLDTDELRSHIRGIADSILASGYLRSRPLTVRFVGETAIIVDGNCRFAAVQIAMAEGAEILTLPCVLEPPGTTEAERTANMLVANSGLAHSPLEMTAIVKKLLSFGWEESAIARRLGKSRQWIANLLELSGASPDVQQAIANGTVSATQAIKLIRSEGADAGAVIAKVAERAKAEGKTRVTAKSFEASKPKAVPAATPEPAWAAPTGLLGAAREVLRLWDSGSLDRDFTEALECLRAMVGEAV